jgi:hypothetical protein
MFCAATVSVSGLAPATLFRHINGIGKSGVRWLDATGSW